jgi:Ca-activated chloride channel family protein
VQGVVVTGTRLHRPNNMASAPVGYPQQAQDTARYPDATPNPIKRVAADPVSTFSIDVDTASYSNVRRFLTKQRQRPPRDAVRVEELVNYFDYDYPAATREEVFRAWTAVAPSPWAPGKRLLHVGLQGHELHPAERPPLNLVFLVDVSGSMQPQDRLPLAQKSLNVLVDKLRPRDRVSMVVYAGSAGQVLAPTGGHEKLRMRCAINALQAGGSTAGGQGLELAYGLAQRHFDPDSVNRVVLLTDGDFNVGVSDPEKLEDFVAEKRKTGIYLSVYGFGDDNYNDVMMQTLAQAGNGIAGYVDTLDEGRKVFDQDFAGSIFPIADDVKIQVEFNPARVSEYRLIGYETRMLNREDFNNDQVDAGEVGAGATVTALYEITPVGGPSSVDPLRYQPERAPAGGGEELAFLRVRFKRPGMSASELRERPITDADSHPSLERAPPAMRWAAAVAAYGQLLRGDPYLKTGYGWSDVQTLARSAAAGDPYGLKREFLALVDRARDSSARADASGG